MVRYESNDTPALIRPDGRNRLSCQGRWTADAVAGLASPQNLLRLFSGNTVTLDTSGIDALDTAGACQLKRIESDLLTAGYEVGISGLQDRYRVLLDELASHPLENVPGPLPTPGLLEAAGRWFVAGRDEVERFLAFFGEVMLRLFWFAGHPWRIRWSEVWGNVYAAGCNAIVIVGLLSFLMGVVLAYQGAAQLRIYGASIYVADLVGLSLLRELAPLLAAIIIAGRTGAAYAAQIGTMLVTEEISALRTIGVSPLDLLVVPKTLALILVLPLLAVFADILGVLGGMVMAKVQLNIGFSAFLDRIAESVSLRSFLIGVCKAPVFAGIIAIVGCYQGFQVSGGAESVGQRTTVAVVHAIFLVIVADALFSVVFSALGI
jgi:phospholipid/cholesterol/gamma-HCH transport system permease protein